MNEAGVEIIQTEETKEDGIKYLNINVSNSEVERNPDIVRLCADVGILEYVKSKTGHWITKRTIMHDGEFYCDVCDNDAPFNKTFHFCPNCGAKMIEPHESKE